MYIVKQKISGKEYYYLRKAVRKGNKVKSLCVAYLGKNKAEAEKKAKEIIEKEKMEKGEKINKASSFLKRKTSEKEKQMEEQKDMTEKTASKK